MPGPGMHLIDEEEIREVMEVLQSGYIYRYGSEDTPNFLGKVDRLEREVARLSKVKHALAVNSGSSALLVALSGLGVGPGHEVIVPGYSYISSISSVVNARAIPVLAEVDRALNLDPADVEHKITPRTGAIMAVHMLGNPARMNELKAIAESYSLPIIEDCAQAFGASYMGKPIGTIGEVGAFSFNIYKTITGGDGGMIVTDDERLYWRFFAIHDQGYSPVDGNVEIGRRSLVGYTFRMTEITAAILLAQIRKLDLILQHLRTNKQRFKQSIADLPGVEFREITDPQGECATLLTVFFPEAAIASRIATELNTRVVFDSDWHVYSNMQQILEKRTVTLEGCPFTCPYYTRQGGRAIYEKGMLPQTDALLKRAINISIGVSDPGLGSSFGVTITDGRDEVERCAAKFRAVAEKYLQ